MLDCSVVITSNKDYEPFAKKTVDNIFKLKTDKSFEIIVCHTNDFVDDRVIHVKDDVKSGNGYAINSTIPYISGRNVIFLTDDVFISGDLLGVSDFLDSDVFKDRKFKVTTLCNNPYKQVTRTERSPSYPKPLIRTGNFLSLPDFVVMCYPCLSKETIELLGGYVFHPRLKYFFDWWLGAFLHLNYEQGVQYNNVVLSQNSAGERLNYSLDKICNVVEQKYFGESYVNVYRLIKNYTPGQPYIYDSEQDFLFETDILELMQ